jgi:outer membrane protein OmpA-like peptidoglycan-associated protein
MGSESYNKTLSEKRATTVASYLISRNAVKAAQVKTMGWGKSKPIVHNTKPDGSDDPEGRAKNRRVEISIKK